jgi:hypothetical protein
MDMATFASTASLIRLFNIRAMPLFRSRLALFAALVYISTTATSQHEKRRYSRS